MTALVPGQHDVARSMAARPEPAFRALEVRTGALVDIVGEAAPFPHRALTELAGVDGHPRDAWVRGVQTRRSVGWLSSERLLRRCGGWRSRNSAHPDSSDHLFRQPSLRLEAARLPLEATRPTSRLDQEPASLAWPCTEWIWLCYEEPLAKQCSVTGSAKMPRRKYLNGQFCPFRATSFEGKHTLVDNMYAHCVFVVAKVLDFCINAFVQGQAVSGLRDREVRTLAYVMTGRSLWRVLP